MNILSYPLSAWCWLTMKTTNDWQWKLQEWYKKIKRTLIFNDLWKGICEATRIKNIQEEAKSKVESTVSISKSKSSRKSSRPTNHFQPQTMKYGKTKTRRHMLWSLGAVSEEVSHHIPSISDSYGALKKLNDLYDTHFELWLIQLMVNLFNL